MIFLIREDFNMNIRNILNELQSKIKNNYIKKEISKIAKKTDMSVLKLNKKELEELISEEVEYEDDLGNVSIPISS